jgi:carbamoyltransferase
MNSAYWGRSYTDGEIAQFLNDNNIPHRHFSNDDALLDHVVDRLIQGKVVGWSQGRFEWGPRALGNRSILADPRNPNMKDIVNAKIKFREPYRPFAPSVLAEDAEKYFELPNAARHCPARYMLYVVPVREEHQHNLPAITNVDLNTSFNLKGEPIVNTPANAFHTFSKSEMDALVLESFLIEKSA